MPANQLLEQVGIKVILDKWKLKAIAHESVTKKKVEQFYRALCKALPQEKLLKNNCRKTTICSSNTFYFQSFYGPIDRWAIGEGFQQLKIHGNSSRETPQPSTPLAAMIANQKEDAECKKLGKFFERLPPELGLHIISFAVNQFHKVKSI